MTKLSKLVVCLLAMCLVASAAVAQEQIITVTPGNSGDIQIATVNGAYCQQTIAPAGTGLMNSGALWCYTSGNGSDTASGYPGQIWAGTNAYNGTALSAITELKYNYWQSNSGIHSPAKTYYRERWSPPKQPIGLRMVINPGDGTPAKMFIYRPFVAGNKGRIGEGIAPFIDDDGRHNKWITVDCLADVGTSGPGCWQEIQWIDSLTVPNLWTGSWDDLKARFPNGTIAAAPAQQPAAGEWPEAVPPNTPNACSLSLQWGAEMYAGNAMALSLGKPYPANYQNWWRECLNGICWADNWRVGIEGQDVKVYDFECNQDAYRNPVTGAGKDLQSRTAYTACRLVPFVVYGRVTNVSGDEFQVSDGSAQVYQLYTSNVLPGTPMDVWCKSAGGVSVSVGDYVRVKAVNVPGYSNRWDANGPIINRFQTDIYSVEPLLGY